MAYTKDIKRFIGTIYLFNGNCVKSIGNKEIISNNPVEQALYYQDNNVDELLIFDLSKGDDEHRNAISIIRAISNSVDIPVIVAGNINNFEDAYNLFYANCSKIVLNFTRNDNIALTKEISDRFGKEKILVAITSEEQYLDNKDLLEKYSSEILVMQDSATAALIKQTKIPLLVPLADILPERLMDFLDKDVVLGVFGSIVNSNITEISSIKSLCNERGILTNGFIANINFSELKLNADGLIPCIVQDYRNNDVLMMAYMNEEAYYATIKSGKMNYYSRSRKSQWLKGETSGHFQYVKSLYADCDSDTLLAKVSQVGAACHTGSRSCFFKEICKKESDENLDNLERIFKVICERKAFPKKGSHTSELLDMGDRTIIQNMNKTIMDIAFQTQNQVKENYTNSITDLFYYMMVLMADKNISLDDIYNELSNR